MNEQTRIIIGVFFILLITALYSLCLLFLDNRLGVIAGCTILAVLALLFFFIRLVNLVRVLREKRRRELSHGDAYDWGIIQDFEGKRESIHRKPLTGFDEDDNNPQLG